VWHSALPQPHQTDIYPLFFKKVWKILDFPIPRKPQFSVVWKMVVYILYPIGL